MDKYEIAQEVYNEYWKNNEKVSLGNWRGFLSEKTKPKDPLFEKFVEFWCIDGNNVTTQREWKRFKEIFKDELKGTQGLDAFHKWWVSSNGINTEVSEKIEEIQERLEK